MGSPEKENKTFDSEKITYENIRRITIEKPQVKRDRRGGLHKLKEMIYFLREHGFKDREPIVFDDVEYAIMEVSQGTDQRTIRKYLTLLVKFGYLKPIGHPLSKNTQVTVRFNEKVSAKTYSSKKGNSSYIFGLMAPKRYAETMLNVETVPPDSPPSSVYEAVDNFDDLRLQREYDLEHMLERVGVTSEKCVCDGGEDRDKSREAEENVSIREKEEEDTITHTYLETKPQLTRSRQKHNKNGHFTKKLEGPG